MNWIKKYWKDLLKVIAVVIVALIFLFVESGWVKGISLAALAGVWVYIYVTNPERK
jgi:hypothetical protein